jgi:hypothetical protein
MHKIKIVDFVYLNEEFIAKITKTIELPFTPTNTDIEYKRDTQ